MAHRPPGKPDFIVGDSLADIFAEAGIHLGRSSPSPGRNLKVVCPKCNGGRTKEPSLSIKVDDDGQGAAWQCHRGNCPGFRGNGRVESGQQDDAPRAERERKPVEPPKPAKAYSAAQQENRNPVYGWAEKRGISRETVDWFGLFATTAYFPQHKAERPAIAFPYRWNHEAVGHKYRDPEKHFAQDPGTVPTLFNIDSLETPDVLCWVEGEGDVLALHEVGYRQIVSLRDGAPQELKDEDDPRRADDKRFAALTTHADALKPVKKVILACDNDAPGMNLREELARRLGKARCWTVTWPEGCKDAGDVLKHHGAEKLRECIEAAEPWPMKGMVRVDAARLLQHRERGRLVRGQVCGIKVLDEVVKMPIEGGRLITIVGVPAHGKALALDTEIPTPDGMRLMGDLAVGDAVFAPDGMPTRIIAATDVMEGRPCYRLRFDDGTEVIADADHLWVTRDDKARRSAIVAKQKRGDRDWTMPGATDQRWKRTFPSAKTTAEIAATLRVHGNGRFNHVVRLAAPAQGMQRKFDIPPYVLGVWLGDGSTSCAVVTCHDKDKQILDELGQAGFPTKRRGGAKWAHAVGLSSEMDDLRGLQERLRDLGVLGNKHVPEMYLTASADQRLALLQGLMDTDGYVHPGGQAEFCSINEALSKAAFRIIASLGMKPAICVGRAAVNGKDCGPKYRVMYYPTLPVFRLRRKADRLAASLRKSRPRLLHRTIIAADRVESVPVRCIQVSHSSGEFLITKAHIPTHNSSFVRDWVTRIAAKHGRKAVWVSPEDGSVDVVAEQMAQVYAGGPFWPGPTQQLTNAEIEAAGRFIADHFTFLATDDPDDEMTVDWLLNLADVAVARSGADLLVVDPWNELEHSRAKNESETEYAGRTLKRLKAWGRSRGVEILLVVHPPKLQVDPKTRKMPMPTGYDVASSAHFFNKTDVGLTVWRPNGAVATEIHVWKSKYAVWGKRGSFATLQFDATSGRFKSAGFELGDQPVTPTRWAEDPPEEAE